jgi:hypothetical protein
MKKFFTFFIAFALIISIAVITSCTKDEWTRPVKDRQITIKEEDPPVNSVYYSAPYSTICVKPTNANLIADRYKNIGTVTVTNTDDSVFVTYASTGKWRLGLLHLYVGDLSGVPLDPAGNPYIQNFPFRATLDTNATLVTFAFASTLFSDSFIVAAYAEVNKIVNGRIVLTDSAWASGTNFTQTGWEMYFNCHKKTCCDYDTLDYDILTDQNIKVGTLNVTNDALNMYITYNAIGNWYFSKTSLYMGKLKNLPLKKSKAPDVANFPYIETHNPKVQTYKYTISLSKLPTSFIIAAHSNAKRVVNGKVVQSEETWCYGPNSSKFLRGWGWYSTYTEQACD